MQFYAEDIMSPNVISVRPELTLDELSDLFTRHRVTGVPVVNDQHTLLGVVTMYDLLMGGKGTLTEWFDYYSQEELEERMGDSGFHVEQPEGFVSDIMNRQVVTAAPKTPIEDLAKQMFQHKIHRVIIVDPASQKPVGIVSTFDLLKLLAEGVSSAEFIADTPGTSRPSPHQKTSIPKT